MTSADLHTLTGAYAVHALDDDERREFERHLKACPACTEEVREFRETAARLAAAVAETPPADLKQRVMDRVETVRQLPPEILVPANVADTVPRRGRRPVALATAACLVAVAVLGGVAVKHYQDARSAQRVAAEQQRRTERVTAILAAADTVLSTAAVQGGGTGTVFTSRSLDEAVVLTSGLPRLPPSRAYQGWYNDNGHMRSIGLIRPGTALLASPLDDASGIGITVEPAGGSTKPSGDPIFLVDLPKT